MPYLAARDEDQAFILFFQYCIHALAPTTLCEVEQTPLKFYRFVFFYATEVVSLSYCSILNSTRLLLCVCVALARHPASMVAEHLGFQSASELMPVLNSMI